MGVREFKGVVFLILFLVFPSGSLSGWFLWPSESDRIGRVRPLEGLTHGDSGGYEI